ncbi:hypothetical protein ACFP6A_05090, partial [Quadrisphaera sp. GCM10027208]|uniref:hypothetical protein n=1 Tax=Quadrisphaera sp. GCM10027208 TaxID=3273423 RepID=UPI0036170654
MTRTNRARHRRETGGRALASVLTALSLVLAGLVGLAGPAAATDTNQASYWANQGYGTCEKLEGEDLKKGQSEDQFNDEGELVQYRLPDDGRDWTLLVIKATSADPIEIRNPEAGTAYDSVLNDSSGKLAGISHIIRCYVPVLGAVDAPCVPAGAAGTTVTVPVIPAGATGLSVKLAGGEGFTPVEKTVAGGSVVFEGVPVGSYTVTLLKDGQPVADQSVQVTVTACPTPPPAPEPELGVVAAPDCVP